MYNQRKEIGEDNNGNALTGLALRLNTTTLNATFYMPTRGNFDFVFGTQTMYQVNKNKGNTILIPDATTYDVGLFSNLTFHFSKKSFWQTGLRIDSRKISASLRR